MSNAAYRYAYSLSSLCIEENIIDTIYDKFTSFYDSLLSNEELYNVLSNETIVKEDIGGIVLFINGKMIDLSVKNELNQIKRQLKETKIV